MNMMEEDNEFQESNKIYRNKRVSRKKKDLLINQNLELNYFIILLENLFQFLSQNLNRN